MRHPTCGHNRMKASPLEAQQMHPLCGVIRFSVSFLLCWSKVLYQIDAVPYDTPRS